MDNTKSMIKSMFEYNIINQYTCNNLLNDYDSSENGRLIVKRIMKGWTRKSNFIQEYERRVLDEASKIMDYYNGINMLRPPKKEEIKKDLSKNMEVKIINRYVKQLNKIKQDKTKLLELLEDFNEMFGEFYEIKKYPTFYYVRQIETIWMINREFNKMCKDRYKQKLHFKWIHKCSDYLNFKVQTNHLGFDETRQFHKLYFTDPN